MFKLNQVKLLLIVIGIILLLLVTGNTTFAAGVLKMGSKGKAVSEIQGYLYRLKYLKRSPDGCYGRITEEAIKSFQLEHALAADGIVGHVTMGALKETVYLKSQITEHTVIAGETLAGIAEQFGSSMTAIMIKNKLSSNEVSVGQILLIPTGGKTTQIASRGRTGGVQAIPWSVVNQLWNNGETATIFDVETGKSFQVKRLYGYYHADIEPFTRQDTAIFKEIYSGKWSWARRAVIVRLRNLYIAASVNGMPHGRESIPDNGFPGQFCAHFLGSRVHQNNSVDPVHLARIEQAANADLAKLIGGNETERAMGINPGAIIERREEFSFRQPWEAVKSR